MQPAHADAILTRDEVAGWLKLRPRQVERLAAFRQVQRWSLDRFASPPVNTNDFPPNLLLLTFVFSAVGRTPAFSSFLISCRFAASEKKSTMLAATFGPTSGTSSSCSSVAAANSSNDEKCSASNCPVRSPTN